ILTSSFERTLERTLLCSQCLLLSSVEVADHKRITSSSHNITSSTHSVRWRKCRAKTVRARIPGGILALTVLAYLLFFFCILLRRSNLIELEEHIHHFLVVFQRRCPKLQVVFTRFSDRVDAPRGASLRCIPTGTDHTILFHLPQRAVERTGIHSIQAKRGHFLH